MIWRKQGTSPNRLLCFRDAIFTCHGLCQLQSSLARFSHRREVNFIEFLVLFCTLFPKDFGEAKQNCQKNTCISLLNYSTWRKQGTSPNRLLCLSDVMFTCQGKLREFMPASKLASTLVLAFIEGVFMSLNRQ